MEGARTEMLIALKFLATVDAWRDEDRRRQDMVDLAKVYRAVEPGQFDHEQAVRLGGLAYPGAERELRKLLDKIDRGKPLSI